ncbi:MBL fold metallo-hydrolase [Telmatospirillum siberiense]|uniref:MBL fold metallo-hydrolase n=1 Tax=Telmatospirillum siberiense TaxID=382514 RepID=A0A2N3PP22_9PROT|nr:MBL fold metallo-hydrolase [Telmatospirillum siberiense]PKU22161.1 MBL fold metallo-hydrolase [Telmatospirillum siberiense]
MRSTGLDRRHFLMGASSLGLALSLARPVKAQPSAKTRLILLGTKGGPRPTPKGRGNPAQVIVVNDVPYVIDCGSGVADKLILAGIPLPSLRHVFITHHHSDHNADYGNLLLLAWASGLKSRVDTWGPPPIAKMTRLFFEMNQYDIEVRIPDEGRPDLRKLVDVHEFDRAGVVMEDENVRVTAALVDHPPVTPAFAYRFDSADRSIVISGDTNYSEALITLAKGADVLVHEALYLPGLDRLLPKTANADRLREHIVAAHTSTEDVGRVAAAAGVKTVVLSHLVPGDDPSISDDDWTAGVRKHYDGKVIVGRDLMEI